MNDLGLGIIVSMKDAFSRNAARVESSMQSLDAKVAAASERMTRNLDRIQKGTMMIGAGLATMALPAALIASTVATQRALGEMVSVGTRDLRSLEDAAEAFTNRWAGYNKAEFIGAAYDVKSALASLSDEAVGTFAGMAALTAKATKASIQEMVGTFTAGYGIFKPIMQGMNDMEWATAFSGAMAQTVAAFKTTGPQMADAIKNIGALAASSNVPLEEQLAIMGQLQTTMPGAEAGTLYKAFMMKVTEAGQELGLSFVGAGGQLKGILPILQELKSKYPDLSQAAAQVELKKAFGSDEALKFVLQMSAGMETLEGNIQGIAKAMRGGTAVTEEMARAMNMDIGSRMLLLRQQVANLAEILGRTLLPVVIPVIGALSRMVLFFQDVARAVPGVTRVAFGLAMALGAVLAIAGAVTAAVGLVGVTAPMVSAGLAAIGTSAAGVGAAVAAGFWPVTLAIAGVVAGVLLLRRAWTANFAGIRDVVTNAWNRVSLAFQGIRALCGSLSGGVGQMSAELARQLQAAGLMGFVVTVFRVYYRVREFLGGISEAFAHAFGRVRAILEPAVRSLLGAYAALYKALFSVFEVFGLVATAADGSTFHSLGAAIGTVLGVLLQVGAFIVRGFIEPLALAVRVLAAVAGAAIWLGKVIVGAFVMAGKFIAKFFLPLRLLGQAFASAGRIIHAVWQILSGDASVLGGLKSIGSAVADFLLTPFRWARDVVTGIWGFIRGMFTVIGGFFATVASQIGQAFLNLPIVSTLTQTLSTVRAFLAGDLGFFEAGKRLVVTFAEGVWAAATYPYQVLKRALGKLRDLLPFSDAREGPLSTLTASGAALLRTFAQGMMLAAGLPAKVFALAVRGILSSLSAVGGALREKAQSAFALVAAPFRGAASLWTGLAGKVKSAAAGIAGKVSGFFSPVDAPVTVTPEAPAIGLWDRIKGGAVRAAQAIQRHIPRISVPVATAQSSAKPAVPATPSIARAVLRIVPELDLRLVPRVLSAVLLLTPVLAGVAPTPQPPVQAGPQATFRQQVTASAPLRPVTPLVSHSDVPLGLRPDLPTLRPMQIPGVIAAPPPEVPGVTIPGTIQLAGLGTPDPVMTPAFAPSITPDPQRLARYQKLHEPATRPATLNDQSAQPYAATGDARDENIRTLLEALMSKLDTLAQRPVEVTVTLDGRRIAQSVYKDQREQRIRAYETL